MAEPSNSKPSVLVMMEGKARQLAALLIALSALGAAGIGLQKILWPPVDGGLKGCLTVKLLPPGEIDVDQWAKTGVEVPVHFENGCKARLNVYLQLELAGGGRLKTEPPFRESDRCSEPYNDTPDCWHQSQPLKSGAFNLNLLLPHLVPLADRLSGPVKVGVTALVLDIETKRKIAIDTAGFDLRNSPTPADRKSDLSP